MQGQADKAGLPDVYQARARGREFCEGFCVGGAIKYAGRYKRTRNLEDLKKAVDLLQIYCGAELLKPERREEPVGNRKWWYTLPDILAQEEAVQVFRMRYGREPAQVELRSDIGLWLLGPVTQVESKA